MLWNDLIRIIIALMLLLLQASIFCKDTENKGRLNKRQIENDLLFDDVADFNEIREYDEDLKLSRDVIRDSHNTVTKNLDKAKTQKVLHKVIQPRPSKSSKFRMSKIGSTHAPVNLVLSRKDREKKHKLDNNAFNRRCNDFSETTKPMCIEQLNINQELMQVFVNVGKETAKTAECNYGKLQFRDTSSLSNKVNKDTLKQTLNKEDSNEKNDESNVPEDFSTNNKKPNDDVKWKFTPYPSKYSIEIESYSSNNSNVKHTSPSSSLHRPNKRFVFLKAATEAKSLLHLDDIENNNEVKESENLNHEFNSKIVEPVLSITQDLSSFKQIKSKNDKKDANNGFRGDSIRINRRDSLLYHPFTFSNVLVSDIDNRVQCNNKAPVDNKDTSFQSKTTLVKDMPTTKSDGTTQQMPNDIRRPNLNLEEVENTFNFKNSPLLSSEENLKEDLRRTSVKSEKAQFFNNVVGKDFILPSDENFEIKTNSNERRQVKELLDSNPKIVVDRPGLPKKPNTFEQMKSLIILDKPKKKTKTKKCIISKSIVPAHQNRNVKFERNDSRYGRKELLKDRFARKSKKEKCNCYVTHAVKVLDEVQKLEFRLHHCRPKSKRITTKRSKTKYPTKKRSKLKKAHKERKRDSLPLSVKSHVEKQKGNSAMVDPQNTNVDILKILLNKLKPIRKVILKGQNLVTERENGYLNFLDSQIKIKNAIDDVPNLSRVFKNEQSIKPRGVNLRNEPNSKKDEMGNGDFGYATISNFQIGNLPFTDRSVQLQNKVDKWGGYELGKRCNNGSSDNHKNSTKDGNVYLRAMEKLFRSLNSMKFLLRGGGNRNSSSYREGSNSHETSTVKEIQLISGAVLNFNEELSTEKFQKDSNPETRLQKRQEILDGDLSDISIASIDSTTEKFVKLASDRSEAQLKLLSEVLRQPGALTGKELRYSSANPFSTTFPPSWVHSKRYVKKGVVRDPKVIARAFRSNSAQNSILKLIDIAESSLKLAERCLIKAPSTNRCNKDTHYKPFNRFSLPTSTADDTYTPKYKFENFKYRLPFSLNSKYYSRKNLAPAISHLKMTNVQNPMSYYESANVKNENSPSAIGYYKIDSTSTPAGILQNIYEPDIENSSTDEPTDGDKLNDFRDALFGENTDFEFENIKSTTTKEERLDRDIRVVGEIQNILKKKRAESGLKHSESEYGKKRTIRSFSSPDTELIAHVKNVNAIENRKTLFQLRNAKQNNLKEKGEKKRFLFRDSKPKKRRKKQEKTWRRLYGRYIDNDLPEKHFLNQRLLN